jgi:hypothetical protein
MKTTRRTASMTSLVLYARLHFSRRSLHKLVCRPLQGTGPFVFAPEGCPSITVTKVFYIMLRRWHKIGAKQVSPIEELQFILRALADFGARRFGGDVIQQILSKVALLAGSFDQTKAQREIFLGRETLFLL